MTIKETAAVMDVLDIVYPGFLQQQKDPKVTIRLWTEMLEPYPLRLVMAAVKSLIATDEKGFPPIPGRVLGKIRQLTETDKDHLTEQEAWNLARRAASNGIYSSREEFDRLPPEVQRVVHDPSVLREWAMMPSDELNTVVASNFQRSYRAVVQQKREYDALPQDVRQMIEGASDCMRLEERT